MESGDESSVGSEGVMVSGLVGKLKADEMKFLVVGNGEEWCLQDVMECLDAARSATRLVEVVVVDIITDDVVGLACEVVTLNPGVTALGFVFTDINEQYYVTMKGVGYISQALAASPQLENLFLTNMLHHIPEAGLEMLSRPIFNSNLEQLSLEGNSIHDAAFLHLARCLANHATIKHLRLKNNALSYEGLEMLAEVMGYNRTLISVNVDGNQVRVPTDTWEGFTIQEQCKVNEEMLTLGAYVHVSHTAWPLLFRKKMTRHWYLWKRLAKYGIPLELWEEVLQCVDPRGYVNQKVRLWMNNNKQQQ